MVWDQEYYCPCGVIMKMLSVADFSTTLSRQHLQEFQEESCHKSSEQFTVCLTVVGRVLLLLHMHSAYLRVVWETQVSWGQPQLIQRCFCAVYDHVKSRSYSCRNGCWNPKSNLRGTHICQIIIYLKFGRKNAIHCYVFWSFLESQLVNYPWKICGYSFGPC